MENSPSDLDSSVMMPHLAVIAASVLQKRWTLTGPAAAFEPPAVLSVVGF